MLYFYHNNSTENPRQLMTNETSHVEFDHHTYFGDITNATTMHVICPAVIITTTSLMLKSSSVTVTVFTVCNALSKKLWTLYVITAKLDILQIPIQNASCQQYSNVLPAVHFWRCPPQDFSPNHTTDNIQSNHKGNMSLNTKHFRTEMNWFVQP